MARLRTDIHNLNAGPAALPTEVLELAQAEIMNLQSSGMSVMEMSHRSAEYESVHNHAIEQLAKLLGVPDDYQILLLQGGASHQFAMLPLNFLTADQTAAYTMTGSWAEKAFKEAKVLGRARVAASTEASEYRRVPNPDEITLESTDAYLHLTSNETIGGVQWAVYPSTGLIPLVADMSSDILSREIDVNQFAMIYAGAQKNLGPSGVTVVMIRKSWLEAARTDIPTIWKYATHAKNNSLYNTPPTFGVYMLALMLDWVKDLGGIAAIEQRNARKAALVYSAIDDSDGFYSGFAHPSCRSRMNITFTLPTPELERAFLQGAKDIGFVGLAGHRSVGGCRASLYNAVSEQSAARLAEYMDTFRRQHA